MSYEIIKSCLDNAWRLKEKGFDDGFNIIQYWMNRPIEDPKDLSILFREIVPITPSFDECVERAQDEIEDFKMRINL